MPSRAAWEAHTAVDPSVTRSTPGLFREIVAVMKASNSANLGDRDGLGWSHTNPLYAGSAAICSVTPSVCGTVACCIIKTTPRMDLSDDSGRPHIRRRVAAAGAQQRLVLAQTDTRTWLTRKIGLNIPIVSSATWIHGDRIAPGDCAGAAGRHRHHPSQHVHRPPGRGSRDKVKRSGERCMIVDPVTVDPEQMHDRGRAGGDAALSHLRRSWSPSTGKLVGIPDQPRPALRGNLAPMFPFRA